MNKTRLLVFILTAILVGGCTMLERVKTQFTIEQTNPDGTVVRVPNCPKIANVVRDTAKIGAGLELRRSPASASALRLTADAIDTLVQNNADRDSLLAGIKARGVSGKALDLVLAGLYAYDLTGAALVSEKANGAPCLKESLVGLSAGLREALSGVPASGSPDPLAIKALRRHNLL
jgi:hypothetical protein